MRRCNVAPPRAAPRCARIGGARLTPAAVAVGEGPLQALSGGLLLRFDLGQHKAYSAGNEGPKGACCVKEHVV